MESFNTRHFATTYYLPKSQGGDVQRPLCHGGVCGYKPRTLTEKREEVTCERCLAKLGEKPPARVIHIPNGEPVTATQIIAYVAAKHGLTFEDLKGPSKVRAIAHVRQEAMWELKQRTKLSLTQIAQRVGRSDHTSARHGIRAHEARQLAATP